MESRTNPNQPVLHIAVSQDSLDQLQARIAAAEAKGANLSKAAEVIAATATSERFVALAMAVCNKIAAQWQASRVSLGMLRGRTVRLLAMSQTERILRKMQLVQNLETAMEECFDQDCEIIFPAPPGATYVTRCTARLAAGEGPRAICVLPIRRDSAMGVLLLEFPPERALTANDIKALRLTLDLVSPRLIDLYRHDKWFGARWAQSSRAMLATVLSPSHTWAKLTAVVAAALLAWVCLGTGTFRVSAPFTLEPVRQATVIAPFNGYIQAVFVHPGTQVVAGQTVLAKLHTARLRDQLAAAQAKLAAYRRQADIAQSRGKFADVEIADDGVNAQQARVRLLRRRIALATIHSPISGTVLSGRLQRRIGSPVKLGQTLFKVAPLTPLLAQVRVSDSDILYVRPRQKGRLVTASYPGIEIPFRVVRIEPLAVIRHKQNVFDVRTVLLKPPAWLRPGMEGTARIHIGHRHYIWIWTRSLIDWLRMKLWL
ncbi:MAG: HlyD family efflux transporter periplasmic adaptor subunit [Phycisphaerae bacterium]|nr:HlyD family efflux transporter periplasmic adaptor subunit [Phycisphaerae bacterium]